MTKEELKQARKALGMSQTKLGERLGGYAWRTVAADNLNEAQKQADRFTRKGFICVGIKQQLGKE